MLRLLSGIGIHSHHAVSQQKNLSLNAEVAVHLNLFTGLLEEAILLAEESNGLLLLLFHDPSDADSRDFFDNVLSDKKFIEYTRDISFKRLITMVFDISRTDHFQTALMFGIKYCPAFAVKVKLQSKFQTVLSHEGYIQPSELCGALQSVLLATESEYAQAEELKAIRSLQSQQDEAYRRSVEADLEKRRARSLSSNNAKSTEALAQVSNDKDPDNDVGQEKLQKRVQQAKEAFKLNHNDARNVYRIQFVLPDGSKSVSSFGSNCTTQDLFDYLFSSELLSSTEVLIRSIDPSFEVIDSESDSIALSSIPNLGKSFRLFVEYL